MNNSCYYFLIAGKQFSTNFLTSWTHTIEYLKDENIDFKWVVYYSPILVKTRNTLLEKIFLEDKNSTENKSISSKYKKIIFLDDDIVWTPEQIKILLESEHDITTGIYMTEDNITTTLMKKGTGRISSSSIRYKEEPFAVDGTGLGFFACNPEILEKIGFPWFEVKLVDNDFIGEDYYFCQRAAELGYKTYADPRLKVGHMKNIMLLPQ